GLPHQTTGNDCGVFILMRDIAQIRKWWCIMLMERYQIEGHGQRFSYLTNEARELLKGALEPVYRVPKKRKTEHEDMLGQVKEEN
ncbi:Manganese transport system membrane protein MntC, partial [Dissostichus eleginoides]